MNIILLCRTFSLFFEDCHIKKDTNEKGGRKGKRGTEQKQVATIIMYKVNGLCKKGTTDIIGKIKEFLYNATVDISCLILTLYTN